MIFTWTISSDADVSVIFGVEFGTLTEETRARTGQML